MNTEHAQPIVEMSLAAAVLLSFLLTDSHVADASIITARPPATTTPAVVHRRDPLTTRFSTVYENGNGSIPLTAGDDFEFRVDLENNLWGSCNVTAADVDRCDFAGECVDAFTCTSGCGKGGFRTTTWYEIPDVSIIGLL